MILQCKLFLIHGCGLGKPVDAIVAAFVAHVEETLEAVTSVITAPHLEYFDIRFEIPPDFEFPSEDVESVVTQYRELKSKIVNVAGILLMKTELKI